MDGVLGLLLLRYSSNILHTPEINKKQNFINLLKSFYFFILPPLYNSKNTKLLPQHLLPRQCKKKKTDLANGAPLGPGNVHLVGMSALW